MDVWITNDSDFDEIKNTCMLKLTMTLCKSSVL